MQLKIPTTFFTLLSNSSETIIQWNVKSSKYLIGEKVNQRIIPSNNLLDEMSFDKKASPPWNLLETSFRCYYSTGSGSDVFSESTIDFEKFIFEPSRNFLVETHLQTHRRVRSFAFHQRRWWWHVIRFGHFVGWRIAFDFRNGCRLRPRPLPTRCFGARPKRSFSRSWFLDRSLGNFGVGTLFCETTIWVWKNYKIEHYSETK